MFLFCVLYRKESAKKWYRNTVNNPISPNPVSQNDEKPHTAEPDDTAIQHFKIKITEIPREKKAQYRNTVNPHVPLLDMLPTQVRQTTFLWCVRKPFSAPFLFLFLFSSNVCLSPLIIYFY